MSLLAKKKSSSTLRRKASATSVASLGSTSNVTPSDQQPRELKSAPYRNAKYEALLEACGSLMGKYTSTNEKGPSRESRDLCLTLLESHQEMPRDSVFEDQFFEDTCEMLRGRNELKVIQDIALLLVPSAEQLAIRGSKHLQNVIESVNEGWNESRPITTPCPQPDYAIGFKWSSFTEVQRKRLSPWLGELDDQSIFKATYAMYFPFFTCETKQALDIADRQNAHSMTLAVRGIVELFRLVKRENELHRQIIAFSVSHNGDDVRIYGHYPVINGKETRYYRHKIRRFCFTELEGRDKWQTYRFTKNMYDLWVPGHFKRICEAIEQIPPDTSFSIDASLPSLESQMHPSELAGASRESSGLRGNDVVRSSGEVMNSDQGSAVDG